ncbi:aminotransferase class I/II-fold pyridoxal phosphate-dependent enzyme [Cytophagaceae bacterium YF14B1]|uniref:Aminotransferase n=1 Tax=Xanthocytophaga flava TaxID=3048013 RepID=A0AAE3QW29_9BACT|nr:aminotransferase class I/II-fold pyridoxal phosphate-dependent enzyme [Xanthocytophaga flavus]MDJ1484468.1 aminotransferase class I/II-fold pyridoxal phosphate-dependent enzyme [Xanthocytophaga flavus]
MLNGHGDDGYLYQTPIVANFSSNVFYNGFPDSLKHHLVTVLTSVKSYPEVDAKRLTNLLASTHAVVTDQLIVTNGATEAFYLIAHVFRGKSATIVIPAFAEYEDACNANDIQLEFLHWDNLHSVSRLTTDLFFICNPNNPTGAVMEQDLLQEWILVNPQTTFILDEAYIDFTHSIHSCLHFTQTYRNVIVVRSMTKAYSIPGLRLGYLVSDSALVKQILSIKMPWSVNSLASEAGLFILNHKENFILPLDEILSETKQLQDELAILPGIEITPSHTNFFLCRTGRETSALLKSYLIQQHGLLIRDASNFRSLTPQHFRIASQGENKNKLLINALKQWLDSGK